MDNEIWKDIPGYEGMYKISNLGRVLALNYNKTGKAIVRAQRINKQGYLYVNLWKNGQSKSFKTHRIVAIMFIPNPCNLPQVNHKDENKLNNRADNLEWCTASYNVSYGHRARKCLDSHKRSNSCKAEKAVVQLDRYGAIIAEYISISEAARQIGVRRESIRDCVSGRLHTCKGYIWKQKNE